MMDKQVEEIVANNLGRSRHIDFLKIPCKVICPLPGMAFLSPKALEEHRLNIRIDEVLPEDDLDLHLFYAKHLYTSGLCKISFPAYYNNVGALLAEPTATALGLLSPFYFQLGYELCNLLPENEWPIDNFHKILKEAECKRRLYLLRRNDTCDDTFLMGLTFEERKLQSVLMHGDSNALITSVTLNSISNFYGFEN
uniref:GINS subunit domain-containing protein n=1 Tax=Babesia bovis TaxID=5865 RepID=S6B8C1_BABBO|nr:conserved hypothetical protein [Babesia bovis]